MTPAEERRWRELAESIRFSLDSIKDQIEAVAKNSDSNKNADEPRPQPVIRAELQLPPAITEKYAAAQHEEQRIETKKLDLEHRKFRIERRKLIVEGIVAAGVALTLFTAYHQWKAMLESNKITREALEITERAYLNAGFPVLHLDKATVWVPIENSGRLPSRDVGITATTMHFEFGGTDPAKTFSMSDFTWGGPGDMTSVPPGKGYFGVTIPISKLSPEAAAWAVQAEGIKNGRRPLHVSGTIEYNTGFTSSTGSPKRDTFRFCFQYRPEPEPRWETCPIIYLTEEVKKKLKANESKH